MLDVVVVLGHRPETSFAAAALSLVGGHGSSLDVTVLGNGDRNFFIGDQIFYRILGAQVGDFGAPGIAKLFLYCFELFGDYPSQRLLVARISSSSAISLIIDSYSSTIFCRSSADSRRNCRSRIACA